MSAEIVLTVEQENAIKEAFLNGTDGLSDLVALVFGAGFDGRSLQGKAVKKFMGSLDLKPIPAHQYKHKGTVLTPDQMEFINNNLTHSSPLDIARELFQNRELPFLSSEARAVREYIDKLNPETKPPTLEELEETKKEIRSAYRPPRSREQCVSRINQYVGSNLEVDKLNPRQRQCVDALINYMSVYSYVSTMNDFSLECDRTLMESSFIRYLYDKGDLSQEEIDLYLNLCLDKVQAQRMQRELTMLINYRDMAMEDNKKGAINKGLVDQISTLRAEIHQNQKRQLDMQNNLNGKRADRLDKQGRGTENLLQLIESFREYGKRKLIQQLADARKNALNTEIDRLESMDDLKFQLYGIGKEEIINGL